MKNNWLIKSYSSGDILDQLLINRNIELEEKYDFLNPIFEDSIKNPELLPDFDLFVERLKTAANMKEKIGIYADYDADGIPGAAFLAKLFDLIDITYETYIPDRKEGYGLSKKGIDHLVDCGCSLIITVDLGIKSVAEADYCREREIDLIITDHHLPGTDIPKALAVVNPKLSKKGSVYKDLSGAGVVYILAWGLKKYFPVIDINFLKWNLDLIAISTISDVVPLTGINRVIAKFGLKVINKTKNNGIKRIIERSKLDNINSYEVGFIIGPRINAPGRISKPDDSFTLLTTDDDRLAVILADKLEEENKNRQELMGELMLEADKIIFENNLLENKIIIISGKWHKGILGPCASKISEKYNRPSIIFSYDSDTNKFTGSARSVNEINIMKILEGVSQYIDKFGGHSGAAGLSVNKDCYKKFFDSITVVSEEEITEKQLQKIYHVDMELDFSKLNFSLVEDIAKLEPFGMKNSRPIFCSRLTKFDSPKFVGKEQNHLSTFIMQGNKKIKSIYFNCQEDKKKIKHLSEIDLIYHLESQVWNGKKYLQLKVIDIDLI